MPRTRPELEQIERQTLAPFAQFSGDSRGRKYTEAPPVWRTQYQRDRDRVIHSRAFRRLEYKTQVFLNGTGDHLRTRLTHTIEVAGISRNLARALRLNEDLAEAIALAHDLGHSPFGHKGEAVLDELMKDHGGFEHNRQSLRVVELLEQKYPLFPGLNLSWETREGLAKHFTAHDRPGKSKGFDARSASLEAQVANVADEIAYYSHDVVETTEEKIRAAAVQSADEVRGQPGPLAQYSSLRTGLNVELRDYLYENLYFNPLVHEPNRRAVRMLEALFEYFLAHSENFGEALHKRAEQDGWHRVVCDYLAGMTDRYAIQEHQRLIAVPA